MTKVLSIQEAKILKSDLEHNITKLIVDFKNETDVRITEINIITRDLGLIDGRNGIVTEVKCKAEF